MFYRYEFMNCLFVVRNFMLLYAVGSLFSPTVHAIALEIHPGLIASAQYNDNINLNTNKKHDLVTEISPSISLTGKGNRSRFNADYLFYNRSTYVNPVVTQNHIANGEAELAIVKNYMTLTAMGQTGIRSTSYTNTKLLDQSELLMDTTRYSSLESRFDFHNFYKKFADFTSQYSYLRTSTQSQAFRDRDLHTVKASLSQGLAYTRLMWRFSSQYQEERLTRLPTRKLYYLKAGIGYQYKGIFNAILTTGYEKTTRTLTTGADVINGNIFLASTNWTINRYVEVKAEYGERAFGRSYLAQLKWSSPLWQLMAKYSREASGKLAALSLQKQISLFDIKLDYRESYTTHELIAFEELNPESQLTQDLLTETESYQRVAINETFKRSRYSATIGLTGWKNDIALKIHDERRAYFSSIPHGRETGVDITWQRKLTQLWLLNTRLSWLRIDDQYLQSDDTFNKVAFHLEHKFPRHLTSGAKFSHWQRKIPFAPEISNNMLTFYITLRY